MSHLLICPNDELAVKAISAQLDKDRRIITVTAPARRSFLLWASSGLGGVFLITEIIAQYAAQKVLRMHSAPTQQWFGSWFVEKIYNNFALRPFRRAVHNIKDGDAVYFGDIRAWMPRNILENWREQLLYQFIDHLLEKNLYFFARLESDDTSSLPREVRKVHRFGGRLFTADSMCTKKVKLISTQEAHAAIVRKFEKEALSHRITLNRGDKIRLSKKRH